MVKPAAKAPKAIIAKGIVASEYWGPVRIEIICLENNMETKIKGMNAKETYREVVLNASIKDSLPFLP